MPWNNVHIKRAFLHLKICSYALPEIAIVCLLENTESFKFQYFHGLTKDLKVENNIHPNVQN